MKDYKSWKGKKSYDVHVERCLVEPYLSRMPNGENPVPIKVARPLLDNVSGARSPGFARA